MIELTELNIPNIITYKWFMLILFKTELNLFMLHNNFSIFGTSFLFYLKSNLSKLAAILA